MLIICNLDFEFCRLQNATALWDRVIQIGMWSYSLTERNFGNSLSNPAVDKAAIRQVKTESTLTKPTKLTFSISTVFLLCNKPLRWSKLWSDRSKRSGNSWRMRKRGENRVETKCDYLTCSRLVRFKKKFLGPRDSNNQQFDWQIRPN